MSGRVIAGVILAMLLFAWWRSGSGTDLVPWRTDLASAKEEASRTGKPLLVYFTASWCPPCKEMKRTTLSDEKIVAAMSGVVPIKVDVDSHPVIVQEFMIDSIPTMVLVPAGRRESRKIGYLSVEEIAAWLR